MRLQEEIDRLLALPADEARKDGVSVVNEFRQGLTKGQYRAAERTESGWRTNIWVKRGILLAFKVGVVESRPVPPEFSFFDKDTLPAKSLKLEDRIRVVPGGSTIRDGAYLAPGVVCMPPMFINIGAYVDEGTMVDSHALVGSCAQIGRRVHLSAAAQIGGVLEPPGALPVIIEDDVLVGGNCGVYEGAIVKRRSVLAAGTIITGSTPVYDLPNGRVIRAERGQPLIVPEGAVIVPGARHVTSGRGPERGLSLATPVIVKYRDEQTDARTALEEGLR